MVNQAASLLTPACQELIRQAAQGEKFFNDDTTMKVLSIIEENKRGDPERTGIFTTGIVSVTGQRKIALFFTGRRHAGEAQAFIIGEDFLGGSPAALVLGDNIFYGHELHELLESAMARQEGATIFTYHVNDPQRYGVAEFDKENRLDHFLTNASA